VGARERTRWYSPRGLGGMNYPFKGFELSRWPVWGRRRFVRGSNYRDASYRGVCGKVGGYLLGPGAGPWSRRGGNCLW
jgi:hypothetical protein